MSPVYRFPVSVKGIVTYERKILLLKNERNEWELPGGKLELHESPEDCVVREIFEEVGLKVTAVKLIDLWVYTIFQDVHVLIATYGCTPTQTAHFQISNEHKEGAWFEYDELVDLNMPEGYKNSIRKWFTN